MTKQKEEKFRLKRVIPVEAITVSPIGEDVKFQDPKESYIFQLSPKERLDWMTRIKNEIALRKLQSLHQLIREDKAVAVFETLTQRQTDARVLVLFLFIIHQNSNFSFMIYYHADHISSEIIRLAF